jgi:hypothetical protein
MLYRDVEFVEYPKTTGTPNHTLTLSPKHLPSPTSKSILSFICPIGSECISRLTHSSYFSSMYTSTSFQLPHTLPLLLKRPRSNGENDHQTTHDQTASHNTDHHDTSPRRRELSTNDIMLSLEVPMKPYTQYQDRYGDEGSA